MNIGGHSTLSDFRGVAQSLPSGMIVTGASIPAQTRTANQAATAS